ncbi:MAG: HAMP domain-containing protein, partial [Nitrospirota bacterium]|nr:HAMP domain-containing protein [Nitrospirota bacterium]
SPHTLKIMASTREEDEGLDYSKYPYFTEILKAGNLFIKDIYYSGKEKRPSMAFSIPVYGLNNSKVMIGIIVAGIDLETSLYELLLNRTGMGETGETLIVNRDIVAVNELRWHKDAPLRLKIGSEDAIEAAKGNTGVINTSDYRGESVLAAYTYIPRTGWGFVAKQDIREIYAPVRQFRYLMLLAGVITVFGVLLIAYRTSRTISRPIEALHQGSEIIGSGNLDHKVGTDRQDEIGRLSRTFDRMIENIKLITASSNELNREMVWRKHLEKMVLEAEDRERRRIGHDLHDDLGQQLSGISFMSQCLENYLKENSILGAEKALRITQLIDRAKEQVKDLSMGLSPMILKGEEGFMTALAELAGNTSRVFNVPCGLRHDGPVSVRNEAAVIHLYRIAQEAVTNAVKHAAPRSVEIGISRRGNEIALTIRDDGTGISEAGGSRRGMGLQVMNYRAGMIGASLDIRRHSSGGTLVTCIFPDTPEDPTGSPEGNRTDESILQNI